MKKGNAIKKERGKYIQKKTHSPEFKAKLVIEVLKELKMVNQIASENGINPNLLSRWKTESVTSLHKIFSKDTAETDKLKKGYEMKIEELYKQIGKLSAELDWLKKNVEYKLSSRERRLLIEVSEDINISRQCELLGINRSTLYYHPVPLNPRELQIKQLIDKIYTKRPIYGYRKITKELIDVHGVTIDRKTTLRYMQEMGIQAIYAKPNLSKPNPDHKVYPYLLKNIEMKNIEIKHPNHVWSTDITYIPMSHRFMYLTAIIDWYSRYVISWELSNILEIDFVLEISKKALNQSKPLIMNSDQSSHYTSPKYTNIFNEAGVSISMDHKGRCFDNIFVERLWRSVKYELVYINEFTSPRELRIALIDYFNFYNNERYHQNLGYRTPTQVYFQTKLKD